MVNVSGGPHIPSHICQGPIQQPDNYWNHHLWEVVLDAPDIIVPLLERYIGLSRSGITTEGVDGG